ncbi:ArsC family reductase [Aliiglaciecola sp. M165]|uniref:ArsC family reductase n=1 Tax=Aliiglaciecola sp. M165 TaxID=2593649 RepID=UPI00163DC1B4|nr:ArsC family reductase [Aliiglaciecola sp. M165]
MTKMFGIKNCDTIKKAKKWLEQNGIDYVFHDYRVDGIDEQWLVQMESLVGWEKLLNQRGTTFRKLSDEQKSDLNAQKAILLMLEAPAMIKRPLLMHQEQAYLGFKPAEYEAIFS